MLEVGSLSYVDSPEDCEGGLDAGAKEGGEPRDGAVRR